MKFKVKFVPDALRDGVQFHLEALDDGAGVAEPRRVVRQQRGELPRHLLAPWHAGDQLLEEGKRVVNQGPRRSSWESLMKGGRDGWGRWHI